MQTSIQLRLRPDADLVAGDDEVALLVGRRRVRITPETPGIAQALAALRRPSEETELATIASSGAGGGCDRLALRSWARLVAGLKAGNWLEQSAQSHGDPLVTLRPTATIAGASSAWLGHETVVALSRFSTMRRDGAVLIVESPRAGAILVVHDRRVGLLLASLTAPTMLGDLLKLIDGTMAADEIRVVMRLMVEGRLALAAGHTDLDDADQSDRLWLDQWNHADLLFHARSRLGRHTAPYGATDRFAGRYEPLPAVKRRTGATVALPAPDLDRLAETDPSLTTVLESRTSVRVHDDAAPITVGQLGELLYRSQRLRWVRSVANHGEIAGRPYPTAGALAELEIYPVVHRCEGLVPGMYRYDGQHHQLEQIAAPAPAVTELLDVARSTAVMDASPQVLLVIAARFGRVMWKYESLAYALVLKNVGALYQTLYLSATAMGLAPCALGGGDADLFAQSTGLRYEEESSVGEFVVGSLPRPFLTGSVRPARAIGPLVPCQRWGEVAGHSAHRDPTNESQGCQDDVSETGR